jgi:hypothetical protein
MEIVNEHNIHTTDSVEVLTLTGSLLMEAGNAIDWR